MLRGNHGVSPLEISLRKMLMTSRSLSNFSSISAYSTTKSRMGPMFSKLLGGRALAQMPRPSPRLPSQRTWHPSHGIVFSPSPSPGTPRYFGMAAAAAEMETAIQEQHMQLHASVDEDYVTTSTDTPEAHPKLEEVDPKKAVPERKPEPEPIPQNPKHNELPETTTTFKMTEKLFRAAKEAKEEAPESYWSHKLYRGPEVDGVAKKPVIHYCRTKLTMDRVLKDHFMDKKLIGFDLEWNPDCYLYKKAGARQTVSLVQMATEERIALFHLALFPKAKSDIEDLVTPLLKKIMEDPNVTKCGVGIKSDCTRLRRNLSIDSHGLFELSHLFKLIKFSESKEYDQINKKLVSLAKQVQWHLHLPLCKTQAVRASDWSQPLSLEQIMYAAADSYAAVQLFATMDIKRKALKPTPPLPYHAELNIPIRLAEGVEIPTDSEGDDLETEDAETEDVEAKDVDAKDVKVKKAEVTVIALDDSPPTPVLPKTPRTRSKVVRVKKTTTKTILYPILPPSPTTQLLDQETSYPILPSSARSSHSDQKASAS